MSAVFARATPWQRLRQRFAMPGCDFSPAVRHWAHLYTESASGFSASLSQALPFQIEQRDLPGEFAFAGVNACEYSADGIEIRHVFPSNSDPWLG